MASKLSQEVRSGPKACGSFAKEQNLNKMTKFFRSVGAKKDDILYLSRESGISHYKISVRSPRQPKDLADNSTGTIKLTGWRKDH